jgi:glycosyltransferase involved in cell wall biosynthesis
VKILFCSLGYGGIGSYVEVMSRALAARGHEVHVLSCVYGQSTTDALTDGVHIHRRGQRRYRGLGLVGRLMKATWSADRLRCATADWLAARSFRTSFDMIEVPDLMAEGFVLSMSKRAPVAVTIHTPLALGAMYDNRPAHDRNVRWADRLEQVAVSRARSISAPSQLIVDELRARHWLPADRVVPVVRYPIDLSHWASDLVPAVETPPCVVGIGRLEPRKGPDLLLHAASNLSAEIPELSVGWLGEIPSPSYAEKLAIIAQGLGVTWAPRGPVSRRELPSVLAGVRVIALPSRFDNFPMAALEGMAAARPVVVSVRTGIAEIMDSRCGAVASLNPTDLASALRPYLSDAHVAQRAGLEARRVVSTACDPASIAAQREALYEAASR